MLAMSIAALMPAAADAQVTSGCIANVPQYKADSTTIARYAPSSRVTMEKRLLANILEACASAGTQRSLTAVLTELQRIAKPDTVRIQVPGPTLYCVNGVCSTTPPAVTNPTPPPVTGGTVPTGTPDLPGGMTVVADYAGGSALIPGISEIYNTTSVQDGTAPRSPSEVRRFTIPAITQAQLDSFNNGTLAHLQRSAGKVEVVLPAGGVNEVFIARWIKPSANLVGDPAGSKSMMLGWTGGSIYFNYETTPDLLSNPIIFGTPDARNDKWLHQNRSKTPIVRGTWGLWEFYVKMNSPGVANGILRVWANGVLQSDYTDITFLTAESAAKFNSLKTDLYQNRAQLFPMWVDMDHMLVWAR